MQTLKKISQARRIGDELVRLSPDITKEDIEEFLVSQDEIKKSTLYNYLKGFVRDASKGVIMLEFFRERVGNREAIIENKFSNNLSS